MNNMLTIKSEKISKFKLQYEFKNRVIQSLQIKLNYPDKIPIICEKNKKSDPDILNKKLLPSGDMTIGEFMFIIKKKLKLKEHEAIFIIIKNTIPSNSIKLSDIYYKYKDTDGFLYINYTKENVFG